MPRSCLAFGRVWRSLFTFQLQDPRLDAAKRWIGVQRVGKRPNAPGSSTVFAFRVQHEDGGLGDTASTDIDSSSETHIPRQRDMRKALTLQEEIEPPLEPLRHIPGTSTSRISSAFTPISRVMYVIVGVKAESYSANLATEKKGSHLSVQ